MKKKMQKRPSVVRKESYGSVTVFWLESEEAIARIKEVARKLKAEKNEVKAIYLFGSLREGKAVPGSDADLLIVLSKSKKRWIDRSLDFIEYFKEIGIPVDIFCYTEDEIKEVPLARRAGESGVKLA